MFRIMVDELTAALADAREAYNCPRDGWTPRALEGHAFPIYTGSNEILEKYAGSCLSMAAP